MKEAMKIAGTTEAWENGALGTSADHARPVAAARAAEIDDALGLKPISIRLPKTVIETFKLLAQYHGTGYQPLMRDALCRSAEGEMQQVLISTIATQKQSKVEVEAENAVTNPDVHRHAA